MALNHLGHPLHGTVQEHLVAPKKHGDIATLPFVTISRQAGVSGRTLAHLLVGRLNELDPEGPAWTCWDRQLVEKVAEEHHVSVQEVQALEDSGHSWIVDLFSNVSSSDKGSSHDEFAVYRMVARTIRALATKGRVVIVGRGGAYITHGLPGGVRLRLVAPLEYRIKSMAGVMGLSLAKAREAVGELDGNREAFCRRYFGHDVLASENFSAIFNAAELSLPQMVECTLPMLGITEGGRASGETAAAAVAGGAASDHRS